MSFKGEIALGALNSKFEYGFTVGDIYRVQGAGNLVPNNLAVANGAFVEWKSTGWEVKKDMQYAVSKTGESLDQAVADVLDDHASASAEEEMTMPAAKAANYTVDNYFEQDGEIWKCTAKTDNGDGTWTIEADKVNGVVPVLNELVNASGGYKLVTLAPIVSSPYNVPVGNREFVTVSYIGASDSDNIQLQLADDCTDAVVFFANRSPREIDFNNLQINRKDLSNIPLFGKNNLYDIIITSEFSSDTLVSTLDNGSTFEVPTDWNDVQCESRLTSISESRRRASSAPNTGFLIEIKGNTAILHVR